MDSFDPEFQEMLAGIRERRGDQVSVSDIGEVVQSMLTSLRGDVTALDIELYTEIESLAKFIHSAKAEIATLRPSEVKDLHLRTASNELDAIVDSTAGATNAIMDATEQIEAIMADVEPHHQTVLMNATTGIYEACSFQDITGQRVTKVIKALKHIEDTVDGLLAAFGDEMAKHKQAQPSKEPEAAVVSDADLLNGPQLQGKGNSQEEIDALLASFD
ncbi:MAG: protein phosphatase CheZ [Proteobacteria bacterium]|nr:protein phosphatase CheZ [Pseudomonadota bacterium]